MKRYLIILLLPVLLLAGCVKETVEGPSSLEATVTMRVAGNSTRTRALDADDENEIVEIDILVFSKTLSTDPDASATYAYRAQTTRITTDPSNSAEKSFKVSLVKNSDYQRLVVFANANSAIETAVAGFTAGSTTYAQAMAAIDMTKTTAWNSTTGTNDPLPMWGQNDFKVFTTAATAADRINLIRSMARVDVLVASAAQSDFTLSGVWLYNPSTVGLLAPATTNWNTSDMKATAETLPTSGRGASSTPFAYTSLTTANVALQGVIYTFEAPKAAGNTSTTDACLIVKGSWNGESDSYYRIDFHDGTQFLPLLRNFQYNISIDAVSGRGYATPGEALAAGFTALTATTQVWDEGNMGSVTWDGTNYLAVSTNDYTVSPDPYSITSISTATNYSGGWKASIAIDDNDNAVSGVNWITINSGSEAGTGNNASQAINMTVLANTVRDRTATITVTAGRLKQVITITQKLHRDLSLDVGDVEVVFSADSPQPFSLPIEWEPAITPVKLELIHAGTPAASAYPQLTGYTDGLAFSSGTLAVNPTTLADANGITTDGGANSLMMQPDAVGLATFDERRSILKVTSEDGSGNTEVKTVLLRQLDYAIEVLGTETSSYQLGTTYSITLKTNAEWAVTVGGDTGEVSNLSATEGEPNTSGTTFTFKTGTTEGKTPTLTFSLKEHSVSELVSIPLRKLDPNCYIVSPTAGNNTVRIPIRKVYEAWNNDIDLNGTRAGDAGAMEYGNFTTGLLWQDITSLIPAGGVGSLVGTGEDAYFTVTVNTASRQGNAVVYLAENGVIRWSWHIWIGLNFSNPEVYAKTNPANGVVMMDRNLGAITLTAGNIQSYGVLYQWGRKDPMPGANAVNSTVTRTLYNISNTALVSGTTGLVTTAVTVARNLAGATTKPLTYYTNSHAEVNSQWWYTNQSQTVIARDEFWGVGSVKTMYDPCPDGWRVPGAGQLFQNVVFNAAHYTQNSGINLYDPYSAHIGFFPLTGLRNSTTGALTQVGTATYFTSTTRVLGSYVNASSLFANGGVGGTGYAMVVRCVKIQ